MIQYASGGKESFKGKKVAISGSGNVAQYAALKAIELGATIVSLSDSKGAIIATEGEGITPEVVNYIADLKVKRKSLTELSESAEYKNKFKYIDGARPWVHVGNVDVALPCATQNEVSGEEAEALVKAGCKFTAEGSNMGSTQEAIDVFEASRKEKKGDGIWYGPGKAANAGGVAVSGLEMAQNSARLTWTSEEVDSKLKVSFLSFSLVTIYERTTHTDDDNSYRASWKPLSTTASRQPRSTSRAQMASSHRSSPAPTLQVSAKSLPPCATKEIGKPIHSPSFEKSESLTFFFSFSTQVVILDDDDDDERSSPHPPPINEILCNESERAGKFRQKNE